MRMVQAHLGEYHYSEDAWRGAGSWCERRFFSAADCAAGRRPAAPGRDAGKNGAEPRARRGAGSISRAGNHDCALRTRSLYLEAEFTGDSDRQLFCVSAADCLADSFFPVGRKSLRRAPSAAFRRTDFGNGARQFLGRDSISMDDGVACGSCLVFDRSNFRSVSIRDSVAAFKAHGEKDTARKGDRLKSVPPTKKNRYRISRTSS